MLDNQTWSSVILSIFWTQQTADLDTPTIGTYVYVEQNMRRKERAFSVEVFVVRGA